MCYNVDESCKHAKWKKPVMKDPLFYGYFIWKMPRIGKDIERAY